ncbi:MAG: hypothetical protein GXP37_13915 [Chloroflexi bacterium]|nr:hypothetical protein [Chloroflexota bacterium]
MKPQPAPSLLGRVLRSSTTSFTFGYSQPDKPSPPFGSLVQAAVGDRRLFGLVYNVLVQDDAFVRQIVAASDVLSEEKIQDMRTRRQVPIEVSVLMIGYRLGDHIYQHLPPHPPGSLQNIFACSPDEGQQILSAFDYFRTVLNNMECPAEELLAASLRLGASFQPSGQARPYLLRAGRELARLLAHDPARLESILRRLADAYV